MEDCRFEKKVVGLWMQMSKPICTLQAYDSGNAHFLSEGHATILGYMYLLSLLLIAASDIDCIINKHSQG